MKALIALLVVLVLAIAGAVGYYYIKSATGDTPDVPANTQQSGAATVTAGDKKKPFVQADVVDNLDAATRMNTDTVAWLQVPNTDINDSVLQAIDNWYYLRRNEKKEDSVYGCYFADYECQIGAQEVFAGNTVIYGHSDLKDNKDGPKFSQLFRFTELEFAEKTPYIYLTTEDGKTTWQIFSAFYTNINFDYIGVHLEPAEVQKLAADAAKLSLYDYGVKVSGEDKLLTLSTCSVRDGADGTNRFVIMAKMLPQNAQEQPLKLTEKALK